MVKNIEGFNSKLETKFFRNTEVLQKRRVENPVAGSNKGVPAKVSHAT